ncbi:MAG: glycoside hydrolase family 95-like protein [bacterium]
MASRQPATVRALAQRNVFLVETPGQVKIVPVTAPYLPDPETGVTNGIAWIRQTLPGDPDPNCWPGMTFVVAMATQGLCKAVAIVTSLESNDPLADAAGLVRETLKEGYGCSVSAHEKIWGTFWAASGVEMEEKGLQSVWYRNLYFMRCVSKPGVEAVGLYAGLTTDRPQWHGAHTLDYNAQQTFWAWYACNHAELSEPYERMISRFLPRARWYARYTFDCDGICFPLNLFAHETANPDKCVCNNRRFAAPPGFSHFLAISGWTVQNLWLHYKFCPERNYLEETAYPAIRDAARFYIEIVTRCRKDSSGKALLGPTMSPEHHHFGEFNSTVDIAYIRYTLDAAIEAAGILKRDAGLADQCRAALAVLPDYPVAAGPEPMVTDVKGQEPIDFNFVVPVSPVYPAGTVNWFSPEAEKQLFTRTIKKVQWNGYNSAMLMAIAHARLSLPDTVAYMKQEFEGRLARPNGTLASLYFPDPKYKHGLDRVAHFTENFAAAGAVTELMLQSVGDIIRVFPAWPLERPARFTNLRAQGGFLVTSEAAQGKVQEIVVTSTVGGTLRLLSPWPTATVASRQRRSAADPDKRGVITVETTAGERLVISAGG